MTLSYRILTRNILKLTSFFWNEVLAIWLLVDKGDKFKALIGPKF